MLRPDPLVGRFPCPGSRPLVRPGSRDRIQIPAVTANDALRSAPSHEMSDRRQALEDWKRQKAARASLGGPAAPSQDEAPRKQSLSAQVRLSGGRSVLGDSAGIGTASEAAKAVRASQSPKALRRASVASASTLGRTMFTTSSHAAPHAASRHTAKPKPTVEVLQAGLSGAEADLERTQKERQQLQLEIDSLNRSVAAGKQREAELEETIQELSQEKRLLEVRNSVYAMRCSQSDAAVARRDVACTPLLWTVDKSCRARPRDGAIAHYYVSDGLCCVPLARCPHSGTSESKVQETTAGALLIILFSLFRSFVRLLQIATASWQESQEKAGAVSDAERQLADSRIAELEAQIGALQMEHVAADKAVKALETKARHLPPPGGDTTPVPRFPVPLVCLAPPAAPARHHV